MTEPSDIPPWAPPEDLPKPAGSLANVKIRRREGPDLPSETPKPGDLTQVLARRRETRSNAEAGEKSTGAIFEPETDAPETDTPDIDAGGGMQPPPPPPDGPTLRDRLTAKRTSGGAPEETAAPRPTAAEAGEEHAPAKRIFRAAAITATDAKPADPDAAAPIRPSSSKSLRATPVADRELKTEGPDEARGRSKRGKKSDKNVGDTVLHKRMAAVLQAESRRREEAAARQTGPASEDDSAEPVEPAATTPRWSAPQQPNDIARFWATERHGRAMPALSELDLGQVAAKWPDSLLLRVAPGSRHMELEKSFTRNADADQQATGQPDTKIDYTPDVIDWVLSQGQAVARDGAPVRAMEEFETDRGIARYSVVALPLGEDGKTIDHILCHLELA